MAYRMQQAMREHNAPGCAESTAPSLEIDPFVPEPLGLLLKLPKLLQGAIMGFIQQIDRDLWNLVVRRFWLAIKALGKPQFHRDDVLQQICNRLRPTDVTGICEQFWM